MKTDLTYSEAVNYLYDRLPVFQHVGASAYKPGLDNTIRLMYALGNPHKNFKSIHVGGTNGKGSVSHFLSAIFQSAGYKTGLYTSPHLVDFGERIRINGQKIRQNYVTDFVEKHQKIFEEIQPSFFEATMAMAFKYFEDEKVDIAIIEVGMGGRLDSTNIIEPVLSVITNISFDHVAFLGDTLEKIAYEKAGIIKKNTPVIIGEWQKETMPVFEAKAAETNSEIFVPEKVLKISAFVDSKMLLEDEKGDIYKSGLTGIYQLKNINTVLSTIEVFNKLKTNDLPNINLSNIKEGIEKVTELSGLQGRWQVVSKKPRIIVDTGHNEAGIKYVTEQLKYENYKNLHIVFGMVSDKDILPVLKLLPANAFYYFTQASIPRALNAETLSEKAKSIGLNGSVYFTVKQSIEYAKLNADFDDLIFIGGSNFVVGEALEFLIPEI